jgi:hypothetical protein
MFTRNFHTKNIALIVSRQKIPSSSAYVKTTMPVSMHCGIGPSPRHLKPKTGSMNTACWFETSRKRLLRLWKRWNQGGGIEEVLALKGWQMVVFYVDNRWTIPLSGGV